MSEEEPDLSRKGTIYRLGGVTGVGWTVSLLAYLSTLLGYGNAVVTRLVGSSRSLLYLGGALLAATLGLDRLRDWLADPDE